MRRLKIRTRIIAVAGFIAVLRHAYRRRKQRNQKSFDTNEIENPTRDYTQAEHASRVTSQTSIHTSGLETDNYNRPQKVTKIDTISRVSDENEHHVIEREDDRLLSVIPNVDVFSYEIGSAIIPRDEEGDQSCRNETVIEEPPSANEFLSRKPLNCTEQLKSDDAILIKEKNEWDTVIEEAVTYKYYSSGKAEVIPFDPALLKDQNHLQPEKSRLEQISRNHAYKNNILCPFSQAPLPINLICLDDGSIDKFLLELESGDQISAFNLSLPKVESYFIKAIQRYQYIGELPLSSNAFNQLVDYLHQNARRGDEISPRHALPAIYIVSMVFFARHSEAEARAFWEPYAQAVWLCEGTSYFQSLCRQLFKYSREYLQDALDKQFDAWKEGDVVRPVYQHAIIPRYLQSSFAAWLVDNFENILAYSEKQLSNMLYHDKALETAPKQLRNFMRGDDTKAAAARLISDMSSALKLFQETEDSNAVKELLESSIEKELWEAIYLQLIDDKTKVTKLRNITPKLDWRWDLTSGELYLELANVRSDNASKPDSIIWADKEAQHLRECSYIARVYPWGLIDGGWELEPERIPVDEGLIGDILVVSEDYDLDQPRVNQSDNVILERSVPDLSGEILYFRVNDKRHIAILRDQIDAEGSWIIVSSTNISLTGDSHALSSLSIHLPRQLRKLGFIEAGMYQVKFPVIIRQENHEWVFTGNDVEQPLNVVVSGSEITNGMSLGVSPVFASPQVKLQVYWTLQNITPWVSLSIRRNGKFLCALPLLELETEGKAGYDDDVYTCDLSSYLQNAGAYSLNLLHGMKTLLEEPVQFAWLPETVKITGPDPYEFYSPQNPLQVKIAGITPEQVLPHHDEKSRKTVDGMTVTVEWRTLRSPQCRVDILWDEYPVHFCWNVDRIAAWSEGGGDKNHVHEGKESNVELHVRGRRNESFIWSVDGVEGVRNSYLNSSGTFSAKLLETTVRDMLLASCKAKSIVYISMRGHRWQLLEYYKLPTINKVTAKYNDGELRVSIQQSRALEGDYTMLLYDLRKSAMPNTLHRASSLLENTAFQLKLESSEYRVDILLGSSTIGSSAPFLVSDEVEPSNSDMMDASLSSHTPSCVSVFRLLTLIEPESMKYEFADHPIIPAIEQLETIHTKSHWLTDEVLEDGFKNLLPAWAVLKHPLRFKTKMNHRILHVFPEKLLYGGKAGQGYIDLKIEDEKMRLYAAWKPSTNLKTSLLWIGIPPLQKAVKYSLLDVLDLTPVYQCLDCGTILASRSNNAIKLSPSILQSHLHGKQVNIREQVINTVYDVHIEVEIEQFKGDYLNYVFPVNDIVVPNYLHSLCAGIQKPISAGEEISMPIQSTEPDDYCIAVSELFEHLEYPALAVFEKYDRQIRALKDYMESLEGVITAFGAMKRLHAVVYAAEHQFRIPGQVLTIAAAVRLKAHNPLSYSKLLERQIITENILIDLVNACVSCCPKLFEWALAWTEIFYIHAAS